MHIETGEFGKSILAGFIQQGDHPWRLSRGWGHMVQNHVTHISNSIKLEEWISKLKFLRVKISWKSVIVIFLVQTLVMGSNYCNVECTGICTGLNGVDPSIKIQTYPVNCLTINVRELLRRVFYPSTKAFKIYFKILVREVCGGNIGSLYIHVLNLVHNTGKLFSILRFKLRTSTVQ